jgi:ribonuclease-3
MRPLIELQQRISYTFGDPGLLERALTHRSYANEHRLSEHNERLEFLGDSVLNLIVSERLMENRPRSPEGELSRLRAAVVSEPSLAEAARAIGLGEFLLLGRGEEQTGGRSKDSLLADCLEALVASLYLDGGIEHAAAFIDRSFRDIFERVGGVGGTSDFKTEFQERCQELLKTLPDYRVVSESGPDHRKQFEVELTVQGRVLGRGAGKSKKEAEQRAAKEALEKLKTPEPGDRSREESRPQ